MRHTIPGRGIPPGGVAPPSHMPKMLGRDFSPQFQLNLMEKDLRYFLALAQSVDCPAPIASLVRSQLQSARRAGLGGLDVAAVYLQTSGRQAMQGLQPQ